MSEFLSTTAEKNFSEKQGILSDALINSLLKYSGDAIAITDNKFRIICSNRDFFRKGENLFSKLKLKKKHINTNSFDIKRSVISNRSICSLSFDIIKFNSDENTGYIIFAKKNISKKEPESANISLINYLKHDLKTHIFAQITALKYLLKKKNNDTLLEEILNSSETSYRILKNHLNEVEYQSDNLTISRKETSVKPLFDEIKLECEKFTQAKNNIITLSRISNSKIYADAVMLKDALINIISRINELTGQNSEIIITTDISHGIFKITLIFPRTAIGKDDFYTPEQNKSQFYRRDNGLYISGKIITLHSGKIKTEQKGNKSLLKIYMPK